MSYSSLEECVNDLDKHNHLKKISNEIDPNLEMASMHLKEFQNSGKALLFENVKGSKYRAVSNIFGTEERGKFVFRKSIETVKNLISLKIKPYIFFKHPIKSFFTLINGIYAIPKKVNFPSYLDEIQIQDLPQIKCWKKDGGAFITLPQVYSEDVSQPGILHSNLGMYRVQLSGNEYDFNKEVGIHYQIHRGLGVHQKKSIMKNIPLKVSIFVGGPPAHTFASVMPLPEGMSEISFAGVLAKRRFRYAKKNGYTISTEADFVICGEISSELKPEGPFGDHLGYYSLKHDFPVLNVKHVYAKKNAIWPFTVVGRPPQEDSQFGKLIHHMTGKAVKNEIPGLKAVNAVDDAGVHPLLLAIGRERYTPYNPTRFPQELLTISYHILGTGQLSLAKYLLIIDDENAPDINHKENFFIHLLERVDWSRDLHFQTKVTIDTLDYSGSGFNEGSKLIISVAGLKKRTLSNILPHINISKEFTNLYMVIDGILAIDGSGDINLLIKDLEKVNLDGIALITYVDDALFVSQSFSNWLWVVFTRSNPASDLYGLNSKMINKHFSCSIPIIDARIKSHHAPVLER